VKLREKDLEFEGGIFRILRVIEGNCVVLKDDATDEGVVISCND
jgi:hypothetical protein